MTRQSGPNTVKFNEIDLYVQENESSNSRMTCVNLKNLKK